MANGLVLNALQGLSGTVQRGYEQRGNMALDTAKMGLARERLGYEMRQGDFERQRQEQQDLRLSQQDIRQTEQDRLDLPIKRARIGEAQKLLRQQEMQKQTLHSSRLVKIFEGPTPERSIFNVTEFLPYIQEITGMTKDPKSGNMLRKNKTPFTEGDLQDLLPVLSAHYDAFNDPLKLATDMADTLRQNPNDQGIIDKLKRNPNLTPVIDALINPGADQTPVNNYVMEETKRKRDLLSQLAAHAESAGGNVAGINKRIARYDDILSKMAPPTLTTKEKADLRLKVFNSLQEEWADRALRGEKITPEQQRAEVKSLMDIAMGKESATAKPTLRAGTIKATGEKIYSDEQGNYFTDAAGTIPYTKPTKGATRGW